eukprot:Phypoly_transcript_06156.p1 GENE.Phypoly_transcript_06156~~Phypoly_transcript_06156.p1  ORF type:complete len:504 (+),score=57.84 Phypoly_transcript_06156:74-1585(+)
MGTLAALRKLHVKSIKTINGVIHVDQIESKVPSLFGDLKGTKEAKNASLQLLSSYLVFLNTDQKNQLVNSLVEILKNDNIEIKGNAAILLEPLIDYDTIHKLVYDHGVIQYLAGMLGSSFQIKRHAFRALYKISTFRHTLPKLELYGILKHAQSEIQKDPIQICSDTCVRLLGSFASDAFYAAQLLSNGCLSALLALLRTPATTPPKLVAPTVEAVRNLARHDDIRLRAVIQAGAVQLIAGVAAKPQSVLFPRTQVEAALVLCELATTKDDKAQELLVRAGIGDILVSCLRHNSSEVKRNAILAIERWMYSDDRMTLYAIEYFLTLVQSGVAVSPRIKELLTGLKVLTKPKPDLGPVASLILEIKQRPESVNEELARLRNENKRLTSNLAAQEAYSKNLETAIGKYVSQPTASAQPTAVDFSGIRNLDELNKLEEKLVQQRNSIIHDMQDRLLCNVCLDKPRDCSLSPCGHTLCTTCAQTILSTTAKCHVCRVRVERLGKMYL